MDTLDIKNKCMIELSHHPLEVGLIKAGKKLHMDYERLYFLDLKIKPVETQNGARLKCIQFSFGRNEDGLDLILYQLY